MLTSAPPELPELIAASVCINASIPPLLSIFILRDLALTIPAVTVELRLYGFPIAKTHSPTFKLSESANFKKLRFSSSIFSKAKSLSGSTPKISAL